MENPWRDDHRTGDPDATRLMLEWDREHRTGTYEESKGGNNLVVVIAIIALAFAVFALLR